MCFLLILNDLFNYIVLFEARNTTKSFYVNLVIKILSTFIVNILNIIRVIADWLSGKNHCPLAR